MTEQRRSPERIQSPQSEEIRDFMLVTRRALLLICGYIEKRYMKERQ